NPCLLQVIRSKPRCARSQSRDGSAIGSDHRVVHGELDIHSLGSPSHFAPHFVPLITAHSELRGGAKGTFGTGIFFVNLSNSCVTAIIGNPTVRSRLIQDGK